MRSVAIVVAGLSTCMVVASAAAGPPAIDPQLAAQYFTEAKAASDRDAGALWGVRLYGPILFVDPASRTVVANQADTEGKLKREGAVWTGTLPPQIGIANTAMKWAGVSWTMVMWGALDEIRRDRVSLIAHECFHRVQDGLGLPATDAVANHLDTMAGRTWLQLEWRALDRALRTTGAARKQALADALAFRSYRRSLSAPAAAAENALERNEGLAEYTGVTVAFADAAERVEVAQLALRRARNRPTFVRSFAYVSGPAYGLLLDAARPAWRTGAKTAPDLGELARTAYGLPRPAATETDAMARLAPYDGDEIIALEKRRDVDRRRVIADARKRLIDGPVLVIRPGAAFDYSFNPNTVIALDDAATVYPVLEVSDDWGTLTVTGGALMIREAGKIARVVVPAPARGATAGDGWKLELKPGWKLVPGTRTGDVALSNK